jgi:hypothetical protein
MTNLTIDRATVDQLVRLLNDMIKGKAAPTLWQVHTLLEVLRTALEQPEQERVTNKSELRRLNEEVTKLKSDLREEVLISNEILKVKDQLLEALQNLENDDRSIPDHAWAIVQAAIAKAEGTNP